MQSIDKLFSGDPFRELLSKSKKIESVSNSSADVLITNSGEVLIVWHDDRDIALTLTKADLKKIMKSFKSINTNNNSAK